MTSRERVLAAFAQQPTDKVPLYISGLSSRIGSLVLDRDAHVGGGMQQYREAKALWEGEAAHQEYLQRSREDALEIAAKLDLDLVRPAYWRKPEKPTERLDEYTFRYGDPEGDWSIWRCNPETELYQVVAESPRPELTLADIEREVERMEAGSNTTPMADGAFPDLCAARGRFGLDKAIQASGTSLGIPYKQPIWFYAIAERPDLVARYLDCAVHNDLKVIDWMAGHGYKLCFGGGDFASNQGPFYSPTAFRRLMTPRLTKLVQKCDAVGTFALFASDGDLWSVADDLFGATGMHGFYEIDRRAGMDLRRLRRTFPKLTLLGNISSHTLHIGARDEVVAEVRDCLDAAKEYNGIIVGPSNQVLARTPPENFWAMIETMHKFR